MATTGNIFNIQHFSVNDGPGIRTVVFFKGCPLDCLWCHNPESKSPTDELSFSAGECIMCGRCAEACTHNVHFFKNNMHSIERNKCVLCKKCAQMCITDAVEIIGKVYTADEVMEEIKKDDIFFVDNGGVTFSGGEPFAQFDFLYELLKKCKEEGYSTYIETSGFAKTDDLIRAAKYTDCFLYDYKETDTKRHKLYTKADNGPILKNLKELSLKNIPVILRCPIIPDLNNRCEHFKGIARLANIYDNILSIELEPYHSLGERKNIALGKKIRHFNEATEVEKQAWLESIRKYTNKDVSLA